MDSELTIVLIVAVPVVAFVVWYQTWAYLQARKWKKVADALGLAFDAGGLLGLPSMRGELHGVKVAVKADYKSNLASNHARHRVRSTITADPGPHLPRGLTLGRQGFFGSLASFAGVEDIEIDHPEFDKNFVIKGRNEAHVRALLDDAQLRSVLLEQRRRCADMWVDEAEVCVRESSRLLLGSALEKRIDAVARVAHALSKVAFSLSEQFPPRKYESDDERTDDIYRQLGEEHRNSA